MFVNSDFSDLLQIFNANKVKYLVIGGYAVVQYAEPRFTNDLGVLISRTLLMHKQFITHCVSSAPR